MMMSFTKSSLFMMFIFMKLWSVMMMFMMKLVTVASVEDRYEEHVYAMLKVFFFTANEENASYVHKLCIWVKDMPQKLLYLTWLSNIWLSSERRFRNCQIQYNTIQSNKPCRSFAFCNFAWII